MITRIEIDGFKSFVDFSLDLATFTAVIGTNAGGKSNLIDAFRFLAASVKGDLFDAVEAVRGDAESLFHQYADGSRVDTMRFAVEFADGSNRRPMRYETQVLWGETGGQRALIHQVELFKPMSGPTDFAQTLRRSNGRIVPAEVARSPDARSSAAAGLGSWTELLSELAGLRACQFESSALRRLSTIGQRYDLAPDGSGLPGYLFQIQNHTQTEDDPDGALREIRQVLHGIIPDVTDFTVIEDRLRRDIRIEFTAEDEPAYEAAIASDGTLRTLAILATLADPFQIGPLLIDEPENGVYPERLRKLLRAIASVTGPSVGDSSVPPMQVLLASHSPVVLDVLPAENVVFLDAVPQVGLGKRRRVTRARRAGESVAKDSTAHWGPLRPASVELFRSGGELRD
ncbi:putative ATPase [Catenulispora sp. EB89]|uniref:AAA family ATPase n=1 Tax=Catenulispora sp. EB89 TaxID=3156257 RepID=UPI0035165869